ncbi:MAG: DUF2066 domain-containing protein [Gammaproteobacteria bacterium]
MNARTMIRTLLTITVVMLLLPAPPTHADAVRVGDLYQAQIAVADKTAPAREQAIRTALKIVLVKLTGDRSAAIRPALLELVDNAASYVQQFSYREDRDSATAVGQTTLRLLLNVKFDETTLSNGLREAGVSLWGNERPAVLVWLLLQQGRQRFIASPESTPELIAILQKRAGERGISLIFPLMDLQDNSTIQAGDIRGGIAEPVLRASRRYQSEVILTASLSSRYAGLWESTWTAYIDQAVADIWSTESDMVALTLEEGLDILVDSLAHRYVSEGGLGRFNLSISNVSSAARYAGLLRYLESLSAVTALDVVEVQGSWITLSLLAHGGDKAVIQAISLGRVLRPTADARLNSYEMSP